MRKTTVLLTILIIIPIYFLNGNKNKVKSIIETKQQIFSHKQLITDGRVWDVAFEDLNKDGSPDLVIANWFKPPTIYYNDGKGKFDNFKTLPCSAVEEGLYCGHAIGIDDFNKDNVPDIFVVFNSHNNLLYLSGGEGYIKSETINSNKSNGLYIALGDIDNDNDIDVFITNYKQPTKLWINDGLGKFEKNDFNFGSNGYNTDLGDINNDGNLDVISSINGNIIIWFNKGNGNYKRSNQSIGYSKGYGRVKLADMDNDKDLDIVFANRSVGGSIWINDGTGVFAEKIKNLTKSSTMTIGDIDLNGHIDMVFGKTIWLNNGNYQFTKHGEFNAEGHIFGLWLNDIDNDGDLDLFYSTTIKEKGLILVKNSTKNK